MRKIFACVGLLAVLVLLTGSTSPSEPAEEEKVLTTADKIRAKRLNIELEGPDYVQEAVDLVNERFTGTESEARIVRVQRDRLGYTHIRLKQYYKGIPIDGTDMIVHINSRNVLYDTDGGMRRRPLDMSVTPRLSAEQAAVIAVEDAMYTTCVDAHCRESREIDPVEDAELYYHVQSGGAAVYRVPHEPSLLIVGDALVWVLRVREPGPDRADWEYWVCASTGAIVEKYNTIMYACNPPSEQGYDTTVTGYRLPNEVCPGCDSTVSFTGWHDTGSATQKHYFLYSKGDPADSVGPWAVFDLHGHSVRDSTDSLCEYELLDSANWGRLDTSAVSVGKSLECIQRWLTDTLGTCSVDNSGWLLVGHVHPSDVHRAECNPNDTCLYFGDGDGDTLFRSLGVLEIVAHEACHALTHFTSNLKWSFGANQSAALNESFSDIMGVSLEFVYQADSSSLYPLATTGCADWLVGEDVCIADLARRDSRYAQLAIRAAWGASGLYLQIRLLDDEIVKAPWCFQGDCLDWYRHNADVVDLFLDVLTADEIRSADPDSVMWRPRDYSFTKSTRNLRVGANTGTFVFRSYDEQGDSLRSSDGRVWSGGTRSEDLFFVFSSPVVPCWVPWDDIPCP